MYDSLEPPPVDLEDPKAVAEAVSVARGDSIWVDAERITEEVMDPMTRKSEARRFYLNQLVGVGDEDGWLPPGSWDACADKKRHIEDGASVVLGFDGSLNRDSTALVVVSCDERPHVDVAGLWERPNGSAGADWRVPKTEVLDAIRGACRGGRSEEIACDTSRWVAELEDWPVRDCPLLLSPQSRTRMVPATERATAAVVERALTHSGDRTLARHVANAMRRPDGQLSKVTPHSPRKIDLAVAFVMALERASQIDASSGGVWDLNEIAERMWRKGRGPKPPWGRPAARADIPAPAERRPRPDRRRPLLHRMKETERTNHHAKTGPGVPARSAARRGPRCRGQNLGGTASRRRLVGHHPPVEHGGHRHCSRRFLAGILRRLGR